MNNRNLISTSKWRGSLMRNENEDFGPVSLAEFLECDPSRRLFACHISGVKHQHANCSMQNQYHHHQLVAGRLTAYANNVLFTLKCDIWGEKKQPKIIWIIAPWFSAVESHDWSLLCHLTLGSSLMSAKVSRTFFFPDFPLFWRFIPCWCRCCKNPPSASTRSTHIPFHVLLNMLVSQWAFCQGPCLWCTQERAEHLPCLKMRGAELAPVEQLIHWVTSWKLMSMKTRRHVGALNCCLWRLLPCSLFLWMRWLCVVSSSRHVMGLPICFGEPDDFAQLPKKNLFPLLPSGSSFIPLLRSNCRRYFANC